MSVRLYVCVCVVGEVRMERVIAKAPPLKQKNPILPCLLASRGNIGVAEIIALFLNREKHKQINHQMKRAAAQWPARAKIG